MASINKGQSHQISLVLSVLVCALLTVGCDRFVEPRIDVYEGKESGYRVTEVSEVRSLDASPLENVRVQMFRARDPGAPPPSLWTGKTDRSGIHKGHFSAAPGSCARARVKQQQIRFKCMKKGYATVEGSFTLGEFMGKKNKTVLVRMKPVRDNTAQDPEEGDSDKGEEK